MILIFTVGVQVLLTITTEFSILILSKRRPSVNYAKDCLDKLFPFPGLVWPGKLFHLGLWPPFSCVLGHFWHGDNQPTNQPNKQPTILVQACSWPVWEGSLLQFLVRVEGHSHKMFKLLRQLLLTTKETSGLEGVGPLWPFFILKPAYPVCSGSAIARGHIDRSSHAKAQPE